ncbi:zinc-ribbon domain-containing protein [Natronorubrum daqingense]|uniref:Double zinc ribbon n=1 Tax=Natronorubrum daqingense TaxID=588898 RepID=A0A1N7F5X9_9EURY|nr:hypothetical protein BB347_13575 [Natronorubrum daqingense]SIR95676.1 Double zinc ribbon [Natronorubrum daqingense]
MSHLCGSCGTTVGTEAKFCPECGTETGQESGEYQADTETDECRKCNTEIPLTAMKCSQCGYEPSKNTAGRWIMGIFAFPVFLLTSLLTVIVPIVFLDGSVPLSSALLTLIFFGGIAAGTGFVLYGIYKAQTWKPTQDAPIQVGPSE